MDRLLKIVFVTGLMLGLAACAGPAKEGEGAAGAGSPAASGGDTRRAAEAGGPVDAKTLLSDPNSPLAKRVFYFDFDSAEVSAEDRAALRAHAEFLAAHPGISAVLEGHADERGTREYNMALGERRAKAVAKLLVLQGAARDQLQTISFGEERPVALGHDEEAWRLNRRVEILYSGY